MLSQVIQALPRVPVTCFWEITEACNLRCIHCEADAGHAAPDELGTEAALRLARELAEAGFEVVVRDPDFVRAGRRRNWLLAAVRTEPREP